MANVERIEKRRRAEFHRKEHMTRIYQHDGVLMSSVFRSLSKLEIENRLEEVLRAFADFVEQHNIVSALCEPEKRADQEQFFLQVERIYTKVTQGYRRRIESIQRDLYMNAWEMPPAPPSVGNAQPSVPQRAAVNNPGVQRTPAAEGRVNDRAVRERSRSPLQVRANDLRHRLESGIRREQRIPRAERFGNGLQCNYCQGPHPMYACPSFLALPLKERRSEAKELNLCSNCLLTGHTYEECRRGPCWRCGRNVYHNSVLCPRSYY